jgi:AcrR family transcriptional regulator
MNARSIAKRRQLVAATKRDTKEEIVNCAIELFSKKGYSEASMREIAQAVNIQPGSIYNHFASKQEILEHILGLYSVYFATSALKGRNIENLMKDVTVDNILSCMVLQFESDSMDRYTKILYIILHEQYRNDMVREYVRDKIVLQNEMYVRQVIEGLESAGLIEPVDSEVIAKLHVATTIYWASANLLGIDSSPLFVRSHTMADVLRKLYERFIVIRGDSP